MLKGSILINLDSEDEGELYVGCAGAVNVTAHFEYKEEAAPDDCVGYEVALSGLKGGHSGLEIILQRGNANKLLARFLRENPCASISTIDAGGLRNAIPREAKAVVAVPEDQAAAFEQAAAAFEKTIRRELSHVEDGIRFGRNFHEPVPYRDGLRQGAVALYGTLHGQLRKETGGGHDRFGGDAGRRPYRSAGRLRRLGAESRFQNPACHEGGV